jgi:hypothetical protein
MLGTEPFFYELLFEMEMVQIDRLEVLRCSFAYCRMLYLRDRAADGPGNFFARNKAVGIPAVWIDDVFAAFQIMKTAGLPGIAAAHCQ